VLNAIPAGEHDALAQRTTRNAAAALSARWNLLATEAMHAMIRAVVVRIQVHADRVDLELSAARLATWLLNNCSLDAAYQSNAQVDDDVADAVRLNIPARLKRTGKEMRFVVDGSRDSAAADTSLVKLLLRAQKIGSRLFKAGAPTLEEIAREEGIVPSYATRVVRLTFLAPDIVAAILAGKQPPELTSNKLMADTRLPLDWREQRAALGFV